MCCQQMNLQRTVPFSLPALCPNQEGWVGSICADLPLSLPEVALVLLGLLLLLLLILNQRKKKIIFSKSKALADTEARYRLLFEHSPIPLLEEDLSAVKTFVDELRSRGVTDLDRYFTDNPETLCRCAVLSRILDANRAALKMYGAREPGELSRLTTIMPDSQLLHFRGELINLVRDGGSELIMENSKLDGTVLTV